VVASTAPCSYVPTYRRGVTRSIAGVEYAEYDLFRLDGSGRGAATDVGDMANEMGECGRGREPLASTT